MTKRHKFDKVIVRKVEAAAIAVEYYNPRYPLKQNKRSAKMVMCECCQGYATVSIFCLVLSNMNYTNNYDVEQAPTPQTLTSINHILPSSSIHAALQIPNKHLVNSGNNIFSIGRG